MSYKMFDCHLLTSKKKLPNHDSKLVNFSVIDPSLIQKDCIWKTIKRTYFFFVDVERRKTRFRVTVTSGEADSLSRTPAAADWSLAGRPRPKIDDRLRDGTRTTITQRYPVPSTLMTTKPSQTFLMSSQYLLTPRLRLHTHSSTAIYADRLARKVRG